MSGPLRVFGAALLLGQSITLGKGRPGGDLGTYLPRAGSLCMVVAPSYFSSMIAATLIDKEVPITSSHTIMHKLKKLEPT